MAYFIDDSVLDEGLYELEGATVLHICSALPATHAAMIANSLGNKAGVNVNAASDYNSPNGRQSVVDAITDGNVTKSGNATHWALATGVLLLAAQTISGGAQAVTLGHKFTLDQFFIAKPTT